MAPLSLALDPSIGPRSNVQGFTHRYKILVPSRRRDSAVAGLKIILSVRKQFSSLLSRGETWIVYYWDAYFS